MSLASAHAPAHLHQIEAGALSQRQATAARRRRLGGACCQRRATTACCCRHEATDTRGPQSEGCQTLSISAVESRREPTVALRGLAAGGHHEAAAALVRATVARVLLELPGAGQPQ